LDFVVTTLFTDLDTFDMAVPSGNTTQRLICELKEYHKTPNESLLHLGPVDEEDLLHWEAVLKGVDGTPYEGK
jgi:peroxin-4